MTNGAFGFILIPVGLFLGHASNMVVHGARKEIRFNLTRRDVDLISDALLFGRLWYGGPNALANEIGYATFSAAHMIP
jgi:hypothetical protein